MKKVKNINWHLFGQRKSDDFPFILACYFLEGHKQHGFKNLLYLNKYPNVYGYKDENDLKRIYEKIKKYKSKDFVLISTKLNETISNTDLIFQKISKKYLAKQSDIELKIFFKKLSVILSEFLGYFVYIQYIGYAEEDKNILKYFDKKSLDAIRLKFYIAKIHKKLNIFFKEVDKRKKVNQNLLFWAFPHEIVKLLITKQKDYKINLKNKLKQRKKFYLWILKGKKQFFSTSKASEKIANNLTRQSLSGREIKIFKGKSSYKGKVKGKAKIVLSKEDFKKINRGDILVAIATMPYYLPIFKKASAIITDEGGFLSHASIMSREFKKPCVINTKIASKTLKDGDLVEVNANKGIIKILK